MPVRRVVMGCARGEMRWAFERRRADAMLMRVFGPGPTLRRAADQHGRGCHTLQRQGKGQQARDRETQNTPHEKSVVDRPAAWNEWSIPRLGKSFNGKCPDVAAKASERVR